MVTVPGYEFLYAERRALQQAYIQRLKAENHLRHHAASDTELDNIVLRLRDELGELRRRWERQHRRLMGAIAGVLIGLLILGGGGWWAYRSLHQDVQQANGLPQKGYTPICCRRWTRLTANSWRGQNSRRTGKIASTCEPPRSRCYRS